MTQSLCRGVGGFAGCEVLGGADVVGVVGALEDVDVVGRIRAARVERVGGALAQDQPEILDELLSDGEIGRLFAPTLQAYRASAEKLSITPILKDDLPAWLVRELNER